MSRKRSKKKIPHIIEKKLGRENAMGQLHFDSNQIEIEERLSNKEKFSVTCHEILHLIAPEWDEKRVLKSEKIMFKILWDNNYRKVNNK